MKASKTLLESLEHLDGVKTGGDLCQIISNAMLAVVRDEMPTAKLEVLAKGGDAIANLMNMQCKVATTQLALREKGVQFGKIKQLGQMLIGTPDKDDDDEKKS